MKTLRRRGARYNAEKARSGLALACVDLKAKGARSAPFPRRGFAANADH
jgi:hypothetical protein